MYFVVAKYMPIYLFIFIIYRYVLYHNNMKVLDGMSMDYVNNQLQPYTRHVFQTQACTAKGCGFSDEVAVYTFDAPPQGSISLVATVTSPRQLSATWTGIAVPNGIINYTLIARGEFYADLSIDHRVEIRNQICYTGPLFGRLISYSGLLPYTSYQVFVNGSNRAGFIVSNQVGLNTPADSKYTCFS